ncbi:hypothetical protein GUJ93_ZPchr0003g16931 [Zizania palustris]|uniref:Uncharacterized protein n=1 Tax=Zizania palustris TaxID=103762 RepID=A0A8J5VIS9_ZIZPA|nr:hypothetical protein GUJ93_ZPchr0003g16931 [Zizania palustris]
MTKRPRCSNKTAAEQNSLDSVVAVRRGKQRMVGRRVPWKDVQTLHRLRLHRLDSVRRDNMTVRAACCKRCSPRSCCRLGRRAHAASSRKKTAAAVLPTERKKPGFQELTTVGPARVRCFLRRGRICRWISSENIAVSEKRFVDENFLVEDELRPNQKVDCRLIWGKTVTLSLGG